MINKYIFKHCWGLLVLLVALITLSTSCTNGGTTQQQPSTKAGEQKQTPEPKDTVYKVGDVIQLGSNKLTVNQVVKSQGGEYDKPKSGNEFVIVKVTIENTGNTPISYNPFDFKMQNSQGQITGQTFTTVDQDTALQSGDLASGGKVSGTIAFEQPKNDTKLQLQYTPSFFSENIIKVNLQ